MKTWEDLVIWANEDPDRLKEVEKLYLVIETIKKAVS